MLHICIILHVATVYLWLCYRKFCNNCARFLFCT